MGVVRLQLATSDPRSGLWKRIRDFERIVVFATVNRLTQGPIILNEKTLVAEALMPARNMSRIVTSPYTQPCFQAVQEVFAAGALVFRVPSAAAGSLQALLERLGSSTSLPC